MLSSWTNKKHDPAWLCKEHYIHILRQKFFLVMKHDQVSWRNLELLCEAQPKGLHKDINFLQNPLSFCIMLWKWISNYCEKWFMSECLAINAIESQPVLYIVFYKVVFKSTVLESICYYFQCLYGFKTVYFYEHFFFKFKTTWKLPVILHEGTFKLSIINT